MAAKHLVQKGAQHPAHIYGLQDAPWSHDRHDGFRDCLQQKGVYDPQLVVKSDFSLTGGYQAAEQLIHCGKKFDAIFAANDLMAAGAIKALALHNIRVPEDVIVVGFDNTYVATLTSPPITTINLPKIQLGIESGKAIIRMIENSPAVERICLPLTLMERRSSNADMPAVIHCAK